MKPFKLSSLIFAALFFNQTSALASGYSTNLQSTSGLANSYAGSVTGIHDASDLFFNVANSANFKTNQFVGSVSYIQIKTNPSGSTSGTEVKDAGVDTAVPALYLAAPLAKNTGFGFAITSPFGLATSYDPNWVGRYQAIDSSIKTINFNPSISHKISDDFSLGLGLQVQYASMYLTQAVNLGSDVLYKVKGSDWGYGYNLGAAYKINDYLKLGLGYRSKIDYKMTGDASIGAIGAYSNFDAKTTTPESVTAGLAFKPSKDIELAYDITWTRWSRLKTLTINAGPVLSGTTQFNWKDSVINSLGANFKLDEKWLLRTGTAYEKDGITDANRGPRVPSSSKIWASLGLNYKFSETLALDASYVHLFYRAAPMNSGGVALRYKTTVDVFSLALRKDF